jgi:aryl-alcohol dehydrogenase-like predicted oxidoreductase
MVTMVGKARMIDDDTQLRPLGTSDIQISPVAFGAWPIAAVTSVDVNDADSIATIKAALANGVNFLDTAYCYGPAGESENLIRQALGELPSDLREQTVIATKGGIHYNDQRQQEQDAGPETLARECDESLARLGVDHVALYYLHAPDPKVPLAESAGAVARIVTSGKARLAGASNCSLEQLREFHAICPLSAVQLPYNMLQRDIEQDTMPWCREQGISVTAYWPLMKGLLAGRLARDVQLDERDARRKYPQYIGEEWEKNQSFVDALRSVAEQAGKTVAQVVINWTIRQPGLTAALCGAKRAWQIEETAGAMGWRLTAEQDAAIEAAIAARGKAEARRLFH